MGLEKKPDFELLFSNLQANVIRLRNSGIKERRDKLTRLKNAIEKNEKQICDAIYSDFKKSPAETKLTEIYPVLREIKIAIKKLPEWMSAEKTKAPITFPLSKNYIRYESKGVVLIISPWNYPFQLAIGPLVSAIAAGNAVIVKPSEISKNTAEFLADFISEIFPENEVSVINGGAKVTQRLLDFPFNHIFFTGGTSIGKIIMSRASEHLTSVTLELGGKSPAIVDADFNLELATEKIIWGKLINAGQTCIAPDYVILPKNKIDEFVAQATLTIEKFYGNFEELENNSDYCRIINDAHFNRLKFLLDDAENKGAEIMLGGKFNNDRHFAPTILTNVNFDMKIMQEEIFGPILPILPYREIEEIPELVHKNEQPLALYIFSSKKNFERKILNEIQSGGVTINDTVVHFANENLPFGGIGKSGIGNAHGFYGFKTFSVERAVMKQSKFSPLKLMYPPYTEKVKKLIDFASKYF